MLAPVAARSSVLAIHPPRFLELLGSSGPQAPAWGPQDQQAPAALVSDGHGDRLCGLEEPERYKRPLNLGIALTVAVQGLRIGQTGWYVPETRSDRDGARRGSLLPPFSSVLRRSGPGMRGHRVQAILPLTPEDWGEGEKELEGALPDTSNRQRRERR